MTTYETVMVVLTCLTLVVSLMMLVIKLLLRTKDIPGQIGDVLIRIFEY